MLLLVAPLTGIEALRPPARPAFSFAAGAHASDVTKHILTTEVFLRAGGQAHRQLLIRLQQSLLQQLQLLSRLMSFAHAARAHL